MEENNISIFRALKLTGRALKDIHKFDRKYYFFEIAEQIVNAMLPFMLLFFSARILNELAGDRNIYEIKKWVLLAIVVSAGAGLIDYALKRFVAIHTKLFWHRFYLMLQKKELDMDYADLESASVRELKANVDQTANWMGWGFPQVKELIPEFTGAVVGIIGAVALTGSLFTAKVPDTAGALTVLNNPLFLLLIICVIIIICSLSGRLGEIALKMQSDLMQKHQFGNRCFQYFSYYNPNGEFPATDMRIYKQNKIMSTYFLKGMDMSFGTKGPFSKLAKGKGGIYRGLATGITVVIMGTVYVYACLKALGGAFGVGLITQYVGAVTALGAHVGVLFTTFATIKVNAKYLQMTYDYMEIPNKMYKGSLTTEKRADREYEIEFKDVSFKYPGTDTWVLRHVNYKFKVGRRLAIVGENGSGKTTFIKLLCRLYDPQEGEILLNGIDIRKYDYKDYMGIFSIVFQDFKLLSQPIANNIAGAIEYDEDRVTKVLDDAGLRKRVDEMPNGIKTYLNHNFEEGGVKLSGGESQKLAIARALYKDAPFLILDEPTAALDPIAEADIYAHLNTIVDDRTAVYISHRLSSCRFCDEILVFDKGQIVERGTHEGLLENIAGKYHELWNAQARHYMQLGVTQ